MSFCSSAVFTLPLVGPVVLAVWFVFVVLVSDEAQGSWWAVCSCQGSGRALAAAVDSKSCRRRIKGNEESTGRSWSPRTGANWSGLAGTPQVMGWIISYHIQRKSSWLLPWAQIQKSFLSPTWPRQTMPVHSAVELSVDSSIDSLRVMVIGWKFRSVSL